jgi:restriction system protein
VSAKSAATEKPYFMDGGTILETSNKNFREKSKNNHTAFKTQTEAHTTQTDIEQNHTNTDKVPKKIWSIEFLKSIEWKLYEELCVKFLKLKEYDAHLTRLGADDGIDIKIYDKNIPSQIYAIAQCKSYTSYNVGVKFIRELYGVMTDKKVDIGIFFTTSNFTSEAKKFAKGKKIQLLDGQCLVNKINKLPISQRNELYSQITKGNYKTPSCPKCGVKMKLRTNKKNPDKKFWGCVNFPRCRSIIRCNSNESKNK